MNINIAGFSAKSSGKIRFLKLGEGKAIINMRLPVGEVNACLWMAALELPASHLRSMKTREVAGNQILATFEFGGDGDHGGASGLGCAIF
jgi:hypothetical protein